MKLFTFGGKTTQKERLLYKLQSNVLEDWNMNPPFRISLMQL